MKLCLSVLDRFLIDQLHERAGLPGLGPAQAHCSWLCGLRSERALITNRTERMTHTVYIIEEHIVKEEVGLKHEP